MQGLGFRIQVLHGFRELGIRDIRGYRGLGVKGFRVSGLGLGRSPIGASGFLITGSSVAEGLKDSSGDSVLILHRKPIPEVLTSQCCKP